MARIVCRLLVPLALLTLSACATSPPPTLTRQEYLTTTTRDYPNHSPEQVIAAAEQLMQLADGSDFKFADNRTGFVATRNWLIYAVLTDIFGVDTWIVNTEVIPNGARVSVQVGTQISILLPMISGQNTSATPSAAVANPVQGTAIYDVFWARMDYLLGLRPDWMTCQMADARVSAKIVWGINDALCNSSNMKDQLPKGPMSGNPS